MYYYIINPAAGGGKINKVQENLKERLKVLGIAGEFAKSTGPGDVAKLTNLAINKGFKTIVAVGGDGTINEAINAISKKNVVLGIVPMGNTNELAKLLGIDGWQNACNILAARKVEEIDLGKINDQYFITSASIGFDNVIFGLEKYAKSSFPANTLYNFKIANAARTFKPMDLNIEFAENFKVSTTCCNFSIANCTFTDYLPQKSRPQDDLFDAIILNNLSFRDLVSYGKGKLDIRKRPGSFSVFHTKKVTITSKESLPVSADGQIVAQTPVTIEISDRKLKVIVSRRRHF
jgi:YegS/Rv2252/BmrU family lipid kinase